MLANSGRVAVHTSTYIYCTRYKKSSPFGYSYIRELFPNTQIPKQESF